MSQYVKVNCNVLNDVDTKMFARAINKLDCPIKNRSVKFGLNPNNHSTGGYEGRQNDVDCILTIDGVDSTIGFKFVTKNNKKTVNIVGDFWRTGMTLDKLKDLLSKTYMIEKIKHDNKINGNTLIKQTTKANGEIVLRYSA